MDKINIYNTRKNILIKQQGLIDAIVSARNNAFIIEHSKEINFDIFKEQSQYFRDENNKDSLLQSIAELNKEEYEKNPKNFGTQYLNAIDATISTSFKSVPIFLEDVLTILKDVEDSLANNKTIKETPKEAIDELCAQINNNIKKIENPSINTFKDKLDEHIK
ncbi:MAG: hypothetical protein REH83_03975, partial [Rickettsiella sp.]|nr:hypothetical protein [Rickettsiella sp.]